MPAPPAGRRDVMTEPVLTYGHLRALAQQARAMAERFEKAAAGHPNDESVSDDKTVELERDYEASRLGNQNGKVCWT
jgi:hypothetical protein